VREEFANIIEVVFIIGHLEAAIWPEIMESATITITKNK